MNAKNRFVVALGVVSAIFFLALMLVTAANVVGRALGHPVAGSYELVSWFTAISMGLGVAYTQAHDGHINIDFLLLRVPIRAKAAIQVVIYVLSTVMFALLVWQLFEFGLGKKAAGGLSMTLKAPVYPWIYAMAVAMAAMTLILLYQLFTHIKRLVTGVD